MPPEIHAWPAVRANVRTGRVSPVTPAPVCSEYCERLAGCWHTMPGVDHTRSVTDVAASCEAEQQGCDGPIRDRQCCGWLRDCRDFAACLQQSRGVISDCSVYPLVPGEEIPVFVPVDAKTFRNGNSSLSR